MIEVNKTTSPYLESIIVGVRACGGHSFARANEYPPQARAPVPRNRRI